MAPLMPILVDGKTRIPHFIYGTAWKGDTTRDCVLAALENGFEAIDSAPQATHYREHHIASGIESWKARNPSANAHRIFKQSKFTPIHDHRDGPMPFDKRDTPAVQVQKSFESSLRSYGDNFKQLEAYLLHSPLPSTEETMKYWRAMESLVPERVQYIGLCDVSMQTLKEVYDQAKIKPAIIQNDFRPEHSYVRDMLGWCKQRSIIYQAYSVLKGNRMLLSTSLVGWLAEEKGITPPQALYLLVLSRWDGQLCILNGTKNPESMVKDLAIVSTVGKIDASISDGFDEVLSQTEAMLWPWPTDKSG